ncbi:uncharacterized protein LOC100186508 [Ciona intestinalis]
MFSGGLLSRNLGRKHRNNAPKTNTDTNKSNPLKGKTDEARQRRQRSTDTKLINWCDGDGRYRRKIVREVNSRPTYTIEVPGNVKLLSPGGGIAVVGFLFLIAGSIFTWFLRTCLCGPVGIGIGLFVILVAVTLILENRNSSSTLFHLTDPYTEFAVSANIAKNKSKERMRTHNCLHDHQVEKTYPFDIRQSTTSLNWQKPDSFDSCTSPIVTGGTTRKRPSTLFPWDRDIASSNTGTPSPTFQFQQSPV